MAFISANWVHCLTYRLITNFKIHIPLYLRKLPIFGQLFLFPISMEKIRLQGIPYDEKSSYLRGTALAPPLIREAFNSPSANFFAENGSEIVPEMFEDTGDHPIVDYFDIERITTANLQRGKPLLTLGGDHSITYPIIMAFHAMYGPLDILHIDAHGDLYDAFEGDRHSHACPFARIMEEGLAGKLTQVGIRTLNSHQREQAARFNVEIIEMKDFDADKLPGFTKPLYVSLDMDALDPAFAPGVSHHEPGGFTTREVLGIIQGIKSVVRGGDIVEFNPKKDLNGVTGMVCAKFMREIASKMIRS